MEVVPAALEVLKLPPKRAQDYMVRQKDTLHMF
jgi:hypothetical protein